MKKSGNWMQKWAKGFNGNTTTENTKCPIAKEKCWTSLVIREVRIKRTMWYHHTPTGRARKKKENIDCWCKENLIHWILLYSKWGAFLLTKQFSSSLADTSWVSYNLNQFWHSLPGVSIKPHWLRAQSHETTPPPPPQTTHIKCRSWLSPKLLTNWL